MRNRFKEYWAVLRNHSCVVSMEYTHSVFEWAEDMLLRDVKRKRHEAGPV
jgi:hypothetical protein